MGDGGGSFCWKDFPGTERIWEDVVAEGVVLEFRRGRVGSVDIVGGSFGRGADGFGGVGRSGRVDGGRVDDRVELVCSSRRDLKGIAGEVSGFRHGDAPGIAVVMLEDMSGDCTELGDRP